MSYYRDLQPRFYVYFQPDDEARRRVPIRYALGSIGMFPLAHADIRCIYNVLFM